MIAATMTEFAGFLQSRILERPVVDQTNLTDRFDFQLKWTPDLAQAPTAGGPPAPPPPPPDGAEAPPDLFSAFLVPSGPASPAPDLVAVAADPNAELSTVHPNETADIARRLIDSLVTTAPPKDREEEAAKAKARAVERFGR